MKKLLAIFLLALSGSLISQTCTCSQSYEWLKETFEKNDAGFQYVIDKKGQADYKKHCDLFTERTKTITTNSECVDVLTDWLRYFRRGHLWLEAINNSSANETKATVEATTPKYKDWETYPYKEKEFKDYISKLKQASPEGIWSSPPYTVGIKKMNDEYIGFVIKADGVYWTEKQVKFKIKDDKGKWSSVYYLRDHSVSDATSASMPGNNYLSVGPTLFKRVLPVFTPDVALDRYFKLMETRVPVFEKLSDKTVLLRIPSFDGSQRKKIDSVIAANFKIITSTENLIIDLQNNGGGSDGSYSKLTPLIYTDPIRIVGMELLSTPLNNKRMENVLNDPEESAEDKKWARESLEKLNKNLGKFVDLDSAVVDIQTFDTVYAYPKKVGVIINGGCGSTTEQFILAAKQSKKVKLFGTTTFGSLDISNMYSVKSPWNNMELGYCLSRSYRIPDFTIDGKGLQPDYYLDREIPKYEWIDFVNKVLSDK
jgi:hypothetical protein